jgi:hypothetical protein
VARGNGCSLCAQSSGVSNARLSAETTGALETADAVQLNSAGAGHGLQLLPSADGRQQQKTRDFFRIFSRSVA